jgi:cyanophycinase
MYRSQFVCQSIFAMALALLSTACASAATSYLYLRIGNPANANVTPHAGYALMGGGKDLDEAFQWLCSRAAGGDFLILRASGTDAYNPYLQGLCKLNSVATLVIPSREAANDPFVAKTISEASAIFIAGGDQANYINFWMGTPVQSAINDAIQRGIPLGGTSAGLAVMGEWVYSAQNDKPNDKDLDSKTVLADPFHPRITLVHRFLDIPILSGVITDSHFAKRDRMGRLLVFLARLNEPDGRPLPLPGLRLNGIGIEERAALLLDPDGSATVVGYGSVYFVDTHRASGVLVEGKFGVSALQKPLTFGPFDMEKVAPGHTFKLRTGTGDAVRYALTIKNGSIASTQPGGGIY